MYVSKHFLRIFSSRESWILNWSRGLKPLMGLVHEDYKVWCVSLTKNEKANTKRGFSERTEEVFLTSQFKHLIQISWEFM